MNFDYEDNFAFNRLLNVQSLKLWLQNIVISHTDEKKEKFSQI